MIRFDRKKLSEEMKNDVIAFEQSGQDAIYLLGNGISFDRKAIITRIQSSNIDEIARTGVRPIIAWRNSGSFLSEIDANQVPLTNDGCYSSYALKEIDNEMCRLRYPLCNSFATAGILFTEKRFPFYSELIEKVEKAYKVKVVELSTPKKIYEFKKDKLTPFLKGIGHGLKNFVRVVLKKTRLSSLPILKGKIKLGAQIKFPNGYVYKVSQQEKFASVMDTISRHSIRHFAKQAKSKLTKEELFFGRLYAEILLSRAINFGNKASNRNVESSLTLQMSNVLSRIDISSEKIKEAVALGEKTAMSVISRLQLSLEEVKQSVIDAGYKYKSEPKSYKEALIPCQIVEKYIEPVEEKPVDGSVQFTPIHQAPVEEKPVEEKPVEEKPVEEDKKISDKKDLSSDENIKDETLYITRKSVEKYVDAVIDKTFKKQAESASSQIFNEANSQKKVERMQRKYNFLDHMQSFYNRKKSCTEEELNNVLEQEKSKDLDDLFYAHSYSNSFINLRRFIITSLFGDKDSIEKKEGMAAAALVNNFTNERYQKALSTYVNENITKSIIDIFKEIDSKTFAPKDLTIVKEIQ